MREEFYRDMDFKTFARYCDRDPRDSFEIAMLPDLIGGRLIDVPWVRARAEHSIPVCGNHVNPIGNFAYLCALVRRPLDS